MSDDNPAAFPCTGEGFGSDLYTQKGMTLRDWFAGQALAGMLASPTTDGQAWEAIADHSFSAADAMLAQRKQDPSS